MLLKSSNTCFACFWMNHCTFSDSATSALVSFPNPLTLECWLAEGTLWEGQIWICLFFLLILTIFVLDSNYVSNPVVTMHSRRGIWLPSKFAPLKHQGFHSTNRLSWASKWVWETDFVRPPLPPLHDGPMSTSGAPQTSLPVLLFFSSVLFFKLFSWKQVWLLRPSLCQSSLFRSFLPVELFGHHTLTTSSLFMFFVVY